ncbi:MAG: hypothetical protein H8D78_10455 [Chloroflexi bacterium]|nr:hypothetical protein [Chloroflexota bacterium]
MTPLQSRWKQLGESWVGLLTIFLDPLVLFLGAASIGLGVVLTQHREGITATVFTIAFGLASALAGEVVAKRWTELNEQKAIVARGQLAVRGLNLLLRNIVVLEARAREYLKRHTEAEGADSLPPQTTRTCFEEIVDRCRLMQEETLSSIENWMDIIPEADVKTQIGLISELKLEIDRKAEGLTALQSKLKEAEGKPQGEVERLTKALHSAQNELDRAVMELQRRRHSIGAADWLLEDPSRLMIFERFLAQPTGFSKTPPGA